MTPSQVLQNLRGDSTLNAKTVAIASAADDGDSTLNARMALVVAVSYLGLGLIATFAGDVLVPVFVERATTSVVSWCASTVIITLISHRDQIRLKKCAKLE